MTVKKVLRWLLAAVVGGALAAAAIAQIGIKPTAQVPVVSTTIAGLPSSCFYGDTYTVAKGDTLWGLNDKEYQVLLDCNPYLNASWRHKREGGKHIVIVRPGEQLDGVKKMQGRLAPILPSPMPAASAPSTPPSATVTSVAPAASSPTKVVEDPTGIRGIPWWLWLVLALLALALLHPKSRAAIAAYLSGPPQRDTRAPTPTYYGPENSGPPMVPGGINETNVEQSFQESAARRAGTPGSYQQFTVLQRTRGRIYGPMTVSYHNAPDQDWNLNGQAAYQARVRHTNGHEETLYMLQACGNDLRYQGVNRYTPGEGFQFIPDPAPVDVTQPATPAAAPEVAPAPVLAPAPVAPPSGEALPEGAIRVVFEGGGKDGSTMFRMVGAELQTFTCQRDDDGGTTIRYKIAKPAAPAADTGTTPAASKQ